jgi:hypothetical protein
MINEEPKMLLKKYVLKSPLNDIAEEVYEYPTDLASPILRRSDCVLVSRLPLQIPIIVAPKEYIRNIPNEGVLLDMPYGDMTLLNHWLADEKAREKREFHDDKMEIMKEMFSTGTFHLRQCKTNFFTGPKLVYKKTLTDNWVWLDYGVLSLTNWGLFRNIESLSVKGTSEIFITGTFESGGEVVENTQCKIVVSVS